MSDSKTEPFEYWRKQVLQAWPDCDISNSGDWSSTAHETATNDRIVGVFSATLIYVLEPDSFTETFDPVGTKLVELPDGRFIRKADSTIQPDDMIVFDGPNAFGSLDKLQAELDADIEAAGGFAAWKARVLEQK